MNIDKTYSDAKKAAATKGKDLCAMQGFQEVVNVLEKRDLSSLSEKELRMLVDSYAEMYLQTFKCKELAEEPAYVDRSMHYATLYFDRCPDDLELYGTCIFMLFAAFRYEEIVEILLMLYKKGGEKYKFAVEHLSAGFAYVADGILTEKERAAFEREYNAILSTDATVP